MQDLNFTLSGNLLSATGSLQCHGGVTARGWGDPFLNIKLWKAKREGNIFSYGIFSSLNNSILLATFLL